MRAAWFGARARNGTSGSSSSTPSSNPWRQLYAGYRSFQLERGAGTTGVLHPDAGVLQWYAPLALGPATLLSLATADSHSWRISSNETSRAGLRRPVALLSRAVGATLEVRRSCVGCSASGWTILRQLWQAQRRRALEIARDAATRCLSDAMLRCYLDVGCYGDMMPCSGGVVRCALLEAAYP